MSSKVKSKKVKTKKLSKKLSKKKSYKPEIKNELLPYNEELFKKLFPNKPKLDYSQLQLSTLGKYSITPYNVGTEMSKIIRSHITKQKAVITEATANVGGFVFALTNDFDKVNAVEILKFNCDILENNVNVYKLNKKVDIICKDYLEVMDDLKQDVVFIDPPWGGKNYRQHKLLNLFLGNKPLHIIVESLMKKNIVVIKVPYNFNFKKIFQLSNKTCVYSIKDNDKPLFYMIVIEKQ